MGESPGLTTFWFGETVIWKSAASVVTVLIVVVVVDDIYSVVVAVVIVVVVVVVVVVIVVVVVSVPLARLSIKTKSMGVNSKANMRYRRKHLHVMAEKLFTFITTFWLRLY